LVPSPVYVQRCPAVVQVPVLLPGALLFGPQQPWPGPPQGWQL
jgi:hypothetical protein